MVSAYVILAIFALYLDFATHNDGISSVMTIVLLSAVLYKIDKLTDLVKAEKKEREKLRRQEAAQEEGKASKEDPEGTE